MPSFEPRTHYEVWYQNLANGGQYQVQEGFTLDEQAAEYARDLQAEEQVIARGRLSGEEKRRYFVVKARTTREEVAV